MKNKEHAVRFSRVPAQHTSGKVWTGRIMSGLVVLFLLFDSITKILRNPNVIRASAKFGYPVYYIPLIGIVLLILTILYIIPRTSIFGAILLTGYLGGAVEANLRIMNPFFSTTLFPVYFAVILWGGLYLRDSLISEFIPFRKKVKQ